MEHRWGLRVALKVAVRLRVGSHEPILGQTENVSASGALVQTARPVRLGARVEVEVILPGQFSPKPMRVAAYVTRKTEDGVAIEWCDLAPDPVRVLLGVVDPAMARCPRPKMPREVRSDVEPQLGSSTGVEATSCTDGGTGTS